MCKNCKDQICLVDGVCDNGCKVGWVGLKCIEKCVEYCILCVDGFNCDECLSGYQLLENRCDVGCSFCFQDKCDLVIGNCYFGCKEGYYGFQCIELCLKGCCICDLMEMCMLCFFGFYMVNFQCVFLCENCYFC